jgi:hypothetical protein
LSFDVTDSPVNFPLIGFQLSLTWTAGTDAAAQLRHLDTASTQPRQQVLELRQLNLQLAFTSPSMFCKNVEDELGAVNYPRIDNFFDIPLLRGGEVVIEQQEIGRYRGRCTRDLFKFAFANQGGRIGSVAALQELARNVGTRTRG